MGSGLVMSDASLLYGAEWLLLAYRVPGATDIVFPSRMLKMPE